MDDFQHEIRLHDLPQTFRDAIEVVRWFPIRYLWIDSLCIQQSREGSHEDWQYHTSIMDRIYANCMLNIVAAWTRSPQDGCFSTRHPELTQLCTLKGKERVLGLDHTSTLNTVHSLGDLYTDQGKLVEPEEMY
jgi:hypothetical protein